MQHEMPHQYFAVSLKPEILNFGTFGGIAHPPPLEEFLYVFLIFAF